MQDSYCMMKEYQEGCSFFAIYDGHGPNGKQCSNTVNEYVQTYLEQKTKHHMGSIPLHKDVGELLQNAFKVAEDKLQMSEIDYSKSGTCALSLFFFKNYCFISHLGSSSAHLYQNSSSGKSPTQLTNQHRAWCDEEGERIRKHGGKTERLILDNEPIGDRRVWNKDHEPGYTCTRAIGDFKYKKIGIISNPDIYEMQLTKEDYFIILGSDGFWAVMSSNEVCKFIDNASVNDREQVAELLVNECRSRWDNLNKDDNAKNILQDSISVGNVCDDITAIIVWLDFK